MSIEGKEGSLIKAGTEAIRVWRCENPSVSISAQNVVVADLDLSGADLSGANISGGRFARCNLRHVSFAGANLREVVFCDCLLEDSDFRGADLRAAKITAALDGARFGASRSLGRLEKLQAANPVLRPIAVDHTGLPWYDRWIGWDRLRFLAAIRIFVPAYASLTLTVLYLNAIAWYNSALAYFDAKLAASGHPGLLPLPTVTPTWTHVLILANFACLAVAATCFLGCPARILEFSRERWLNELRQPEILYEHTSWQQPLMRMLCAGALLIGGVLSIYLLGRGILHQMTLILRPFV